MGTSLQKLFRQTFEGHKGRIGKVGGSLPRGVTRTEISDLAKRHLKYDRDAYIDKVERVLDEMPLSPRLASIAGEVNLDVREEMGSNYAGHFGNTIQVSRAAIEGKFGKTLAEAYRFAPTVLHGVVAHEMGHHIQGRLEFEEAFEWNELVKDRNLFSGFRKNKLPDIEETFASPLRANELFAESFSLYMWDPMQLPGPVLDYMDSIAMDISKNQQLFTKNGKGFHDHRGRPGKVGGSLPRGASASFGKTVGGGSAAAQAMGENIIVDKTQYSNMSDASRRNLVAHELAHNLVEDRLLNDMQEWDKATEALLIETVERKGSTYFRYMLGESRIGEAMVSTIAARVTSAEKPPAWSDEQWSKAMDWADHALDYSGWTKEEFIALVEEVKSGLDKDLYQNSLFQQKSGHFGHKGRPGKIGGSLPRSGAATRDSSIKKYDTFEEMSAQHDKQNRLPYFIDPEGNIIDTDGMEHPRFLYWTKERYPEDFLNEFGEGYSIENSYDFQQSVIGRGYMRVRSYGKELLIETQYADRKTLSLLQKYHEQGKFPTGFSKVAWEGIDYNNVRNLGKDTIGGSAPNKIYVNTDYNEFFSGDKIIWDEDEYTYKVKQNKLFVQGGPGSGFQGHRGRPGKVGGSSKGDRSLEDVLDEQEEANEEINQELQDWLEKKKDKLREGIDERLAEEQRHRKRVESVANKFGYPVEQVESTLDKGYTFTVGGQTFRAGADYDPKTGKIRVFDVDELRDSELEGILAHEIQHSRWKQYHDAYQQQFIEVEKSIRSTEDKSQWLIRMDGSLRYESDKKRLWAYDLHENFLIHSTRNWNKLQEADGVSDYSASYWNAANASGSAFDFDRAVDETLAEIARIQLQNKTSSVTTKIKPVWMTLFGKVHRGTKIKKNMLFYFEGE